MLDFEKKWEGDVLTVTLNGKMDTNTTPKIAEAITADVEKAETMILDMKDLKYISSAGLRLLLKLHKAMSKKGGMKLTNVSETNKEIFDFTGFADILNIE